MKSFLIPVCALMISIAPAQSSEISLDDLGNLQRANVYILGETHDNPLHHLGQARAIKALHPKAVVFEMLTPEQAARITPELLQNEEALEAVLGWNGSGWPDFSMYYPVFSALGDAKIFGAALPRQEVRRAFYDGAADVFGDGAQAYGLDNPLPERDLKIRMQEQFEAHCEAMPLEMMDGMVESQRLRDAAFANAVIKAFEETGGTYDGLIAKGGPVVLIAGTGHAHYDWAVPAMLAKAKGQLSLISIAFLEAPVAPDKRYDFWIETEPAKREDPCLAFK